MRTTTWTMFGQARWTTFGPASAASVALWILICAAASGTAVAGPNAGGVLGITYTPYVGCFNGDEPQTGDLYCDEFELTQCEAAVVRRDTDQAILLHIFAAFPPGSSPRLSGLTFGIDYPTPLISMIDAAHCGDFELPTESWPDPGSGTAVTWGTPQLSEITLIYWIAAYSYYGDPGTLALTPHPTQGALFADDDVPSNIDPIAALGSFGFYTDGTLYCPDGPRLGACCIGEDCLVLSGDECLALGGTFYGEGSECNPTLCLGTPTIESSWGEVKSRYR